MYSAERYKETQEWNSWNAGATCYVEFLTKGYADNAGQEGGTTAMPILAELQGRPEDLETQCLFCGIRV